MRAAGLWIVGLLSWSGLHAQARFHAGSDTTGFRSVAKIALPKSCVDENSKPRFAGLKTSFGDTEIRVDKSGLVVEAVRRSDGGKSTLKLNLYDGTFGNAEGNFSRLSGRRDFSTDKEPDPELISRLGTELSSGADKNPQLQACLVAMSAAIGSRHQSLKAGKLSLDEITEDMIHNYEQKSLKYDDPKGDAILCQKMLNSPEILKKMKNGTYNEAEYPRPKWVDELENSEKASTKKSEGRPILGRESPFDTKAMEAMFLEVLRSESAAGLKITAGQEHEWSPEVRKQLGGKCAIPLMFSKMLLALAAGQTALHMATGLEDKYLDWILEQKPDSITPESAFRSALRLSKGDVYLALLTIENVYSAAWKRPDREDLPWARRVRSIINSHGQGRDNFGPWYHMWGTTLFSYVRGSGPAKLVSKLETAGTMSIANSDRAQKHHANMAGASVGGRLAKIVRKESYRDALPNPEALKFENYIQQDEDFRDRLPIKKSPILGLSVRKTTTGSPGSKAPQSVRTDAKVTSTKALQGCIVEFIPADHKGLDSRDIVRFENVSFAAGETKSFVLSRSAGYSGARVFIRDCSSSPSTSLAQESLK
jgi:hypothetical protein